MHQSDHISPSKSGLDLHLLPAYAHVTSNYTEWFPSSAIYSSLSCYLLCPLFQIPFPPPLPLRPYPLWHPSLIFKATFKHSFLVRLISRATGGLLRTLLTALVSVTPLATWYYNCWETDPILWTNHAIPGVTMSISVSPTPHAEHKVGPQFEAHKCIFEWLDPCFTLFLFSYCCLNSITASSFVLVFVLLNLKNLWFFSFFGHFGVIFRLLFPFCGVLQ